MRHLRIKTYRHLDGSTSLTMVFPVGTRRTKRRTLKKWARRSYEFAVRTGARKKPSPHVRRLVRESRAAVWIDKRTE